MWWPQCPSCQNRGWEVFSGEAVHIDKFCGHLRIEERTLWKQHNKDAEAGNQAYPVAGTSEPTWTVPSGGSCLEGRWWIEAQGWEADVFHPAGAQVLRAALPIHREPVLVININNCFFKFSVLAWEKGEIVMYSELSFWNHKVEAPVQWEWCSLLPLAAKKTSQDYCWIVVLCPRR